jgi:rhodanese-related sulfurtransferase
MNQGQATTETVSGEEARQLLGRGQAKAFDLRDNESWHSYQVPGSHQIEEGSLREALEELSKDTKVILVCEDGKRSGEVAAELREDGWDATCLEGGIGSWETANVEALPRSDFEYEGPGDKPPGT